MTIHGFQRVLDEIRAISETETEKGRLFERLMATYIRHHQPPKPTVRESGAAPFEPDGSACVSVPNWPPHRTKGANGLPCGDCSPSEGAGDSKGRLYLLWKRVSHDPLPTLVPMSVRAGCVQSKPRMSPSDKRPGRSPGLHCPYAKRGPQWPGKNCYLYGLCCVFSASWICSVV